MERPAVSRLDPAALDALAVVLRHHGVSTTSADLIARHGLAGRPLHVATFRSAACK